MTFLSTNVCVGEIAIIAIFITISDVNYILKTYYDSFPQYTILQMGAKTHNEMRQCATSGNKHNKNVFAWAGLSINI